MTSNARTIWTYSTGSAIASSPAISSSLGAVYLGCTDSNVYAFTLSGTLLWKYKTGAAVLSSPAVGSDGTVYIGSNDTYAYALTSSGKLKWKFETNDAIYCKPVIGSDGTIFMGSTDGYMYAIAPSTGTQKWQFDAGDPIYFSPTIGSTGVVYFSNAYGLVYALSASNGKVIWQYDTKSDILSSPVVGPGEIIYIGTFSGYLYVFSSTGSASRYHVGPAQSSELYSPALSADGKTLYIGQYSAVSSYGSHLYAFNTTRRSFTWKFAIGNETYFAPTIGPDGSIYFGCYDSYVYALKPDGTLKWSFLTGDIVQSSPAVYNGVVYVGSADGVFYALDSGESKSIITSFLN